MKQKNLVSIWIFFYFSIIKFSLPGSSKCKTYLKIIDCRLLDQDQDQEERKVQDQGVNPTQGADQGKTLIQGSYENVNES